MENTQNTTPAPVPSFALADQTIVVAYTVNVTRDRIADTLCAALEAGSTYWCEKVRVSDYRGYEWAHEAIAASSPFSFKVFEEAAFQYPKLTLGAAVRKLAEDFPRHFGDMMGETEDAETGDALFQLLCFGEIVYG